MGRFRRGWYERIEPLKINSDWVKLHCKLTPREKQILQIVYERKLIRRDHLEIIHEGYRDIPQRTQVLNRSMKKLFEKLCVDKVHEESEYMTGNNPAIYSLDRSGAIIINKPFKRRIYQNKKIINSKELIFREIPANYPHIHGINALEVATIEYILLKNYQYKWFLEENNAKTFKYGLETVILIPDVFLLIKTIKNSILLIFIEYDTGSENFRYKSAFPILGEKIQKYQQYKATGIWKEEWWAKQIKVNKFPLVLFVTEDAKRVKYILERSAKLGLWADAVIPSDYIKKLDGLSEGVLTET